MESEGKKIILGVTGSIAAPKALELAKLLKAAGHELRVILTPASLHFVDEAGFRSITGHQPASEQLPFKAGEEPDFTHIELSDSDLLVVAPATANTIGKMANGIADNLLLSTCLAFDKPVVICPAMNQRMWKHPAVQTNIATLLQRGVVMVPPETGTLACGEEGIGRLAEPGVIARRVRDLVDVPRKQDLADVRVLVTAGGTREPVDSVRFIGNRSSGKMGFSIAEAASARGARVTLVAANCSLPTPGGSRRVDVTTAYDLEEALRKEFIDCDVLVMAAAVSDYRVSSGNATGKKSRGKEFYLHLLPTADIVSNLSNGSGDKLKVGFAAEYGAGGIDRARRKLREKDLDMIVFNDISRSDIGFDSDFNELVIISRGEPEQEVERTSKAMCAGRILDNVVGLLEKGRGSMEITGGDET